MKEKNELIWDIENVEDVSAPTVTQDPSGVGVIPKASVIATWKFKDRQLKLPDTWQDNIRLGSNVSYLITSHQPSKLRGVDR